MARPLKPLVRGGGYYPSNKWTPLVYPGGYTTANGGEQPMPINWETVSGISPLVLSSALARAMQKLIQYGKCEQSGTDVVCNNGVLKARRKSGLPLRYQPVEYMIASIKTPVGIKTKDTYEIEAKIYRKNNVAQYIYQSDSGSTLTTNTTAYISTSGNWRFGKDAVLITPPLGQTLVTKQNKEGVWINGELQAAYEDVGTFTSVNDFAIAGSQTQASMRIYYVKVRDLSDNNALILDCVPVHDLDGDVYGWYDKVAQAFYTSADVTYTPGADVDDPAVIYTDGTDEVLTVSGKNLFDDAAIRLLEETSTPDRWGEMIYVSAGTYTAAWTQNANGNLYIQVYDGGKWETFQSIPKSGITVTLTGNGKILIFCGRGSNTPENLLDHKIQVERGDTATDYEPYVTPQTVTDIPMLLGVGDTKDELDVITGLLTHRMEAVYENGGIVIKELAEPVTEQTTPHHLRTADGTNTVTATSEVDPVTLSATYALSEE